MLFDEAPRILDANIHSVDALHFVDLKSYADRIKENERKTGSPEAIVTAGDDRLHPVYILAMDFGSSAASVASVVGEKIARLRAALETGGGHHRLLLGACACRKACSRSCRCQDERGHRPPRRSPDPLHLGPGDPTTGGTTASFAMLGDINVAEPRP